MKLTWIENQIREAEKSLIKTKQVARWKLDNGFERWLSYRADNSYLWKKVYVLYYKLFDRQYYLGGLEAINREIQVFKGDIGERWSGLLRQETGIHKWEAALG